LSQEAKEYYGFSLRPLEDKSQASKKQLKIKKSRKKEIDEDLPNFFRTLIPSEHTNLFITQ